jgi:hypothetical protein
MTTYYEDEIITLNDWRIYHYVSGYNKEIQSMSLYHLCELTKMSFTPDNHCPTCKKEVPKGIFLKMEHMKLSI